MKKVIFKENVFIITGVSSGIGEELALQLADHGAWLTLAARNAEKVQEVAEECNQRGGRADAIPDEMEQKTKADNANPIEVMIFQAKRLWPTLAILTAYP
ncbi:MAG: SDR family NAD(P)-dependent oxidoreductase [Anaerolineales bacterium]|nr:SDR family NAD(P)-dependent oxidoreductase [Anaerolineales bacterium]